MGGKNRADAFMPRGLQYKTDGHSTKEAATYYEYDSSVPLVPRWHHSRAPSLLALYIYFRILRNRMESHT